MKAPTCPYCRSLGRLTSGREVYPHRPDLASKPIYACMPCGAWVGCHPGTTKPLGRMANADLRALKKKAHEVFDRRWKGRQSVNGSPRKSAYTWLAARMGMEFKRCHIGYFSEDECTRVIELCEAEPLA